MSGPTPLFCTQCKQNRQTAGSELCADCVEYQQLLKEDILTCPLFLKELDFQAFMHRFAVHAHAQRTPEAGNVTLLQMELRLTEVVLRAIPPYYVSLLEYDRYEQQQVGGAKGGYTFKTALPQDLLFKTLEKKALIRPQDPDGTEV